MAQSKERNTFIMMITTFISRLLGILKARAISSFFGAGLIADAINFSYNIPNNLRKLFAEGALSQAYLPIFSKLKDDDENTSSFLGALFTFQLIIFIPLIVLSFIFSKPFITLLSGFNDENQIVIAANLLPFFLTFLFFISLSTLLSTVLQTRKAFLITGIGPIFFTLTVILSIYLFTNKLSYYSMALGCTAGSIIQMVSQAIVVKKRKIKLKLSNPLKSKWFILTLKAFIPATLYSFILILDQYLSFYIASMLESGAVSAISNSIIFYQTPYGIFFASISTVFFPLIAGEKDDEIKAKVDSVLKVCGLYEMRSWPVSALSYGQKKRVTIASILSMDPEIIILDEPTAGQDLRHYTEIMEFLKKLNSLGVTIILITHDMHLMLEYTKRAVVFTNGLLIADTSCEEILTDERRCEEASLKKTSLSALASLCSLPETEFVRRFIQEDKRRRA